MPSKEAATVTVTAQIKPWFFFALLVIRRVSVPFVKIGLLSNDQVVNFAAFLGRKAIDFKVNDG